MNYAATGRLSGDYFSVRFKEATIQQNRRKFPTGETPNNRKDHKKKKTFCFGKKKKQKKKVSYNTQSKQVIRKVAI